LEAGTNVGHPMSPTKKPKTQITKPKQFQKPKTQIPKPERSHSVFGLWSFEIGLCLGFVLCVFVSFVFRLAR
ncbi:MAG: hypothetical protein U1A28_02635, partial [Patescibacteria group bacterium]|nr:hypothetical protein [Patescibacteria group bacterium]